VRKIQEYHARGGRDRTGILYSLRDSGRSKIHELNIIQDTTGGLRDRNIG
jgi:hypothetical protein